MKHLSIEMGAIAALALSLCTSFSPAKSEFATTPGSSGVSGKFDKPEKKALLMSRSEYYYWYSYPGNVYEGYMPTSLEVYDLEVELQTDVDTDPSGGVQIANGFIVYGLPHIIWPSVILFAHY
ncbi:MAG TPA: hypothetical protein VGS79_29680 [Puia sp.]|nr:hypothetical protein [Puia sp.]